MVLEQHLLSLWNLVPKLFFPFHLVDFDEDLYNKQKKEIQSPPKLEFSTRKRIKSTIIIHHTINNAIMLVFFR